MTGGTELTAGTLAVEGCTLHYWTCGPEDGPPVLLSHGATLDHRSWLPQVPALAQTYRVIVWDMRGQGLSRPSSGGFSFPRFAGDMAALLDHLGVERAALVGLSLGGYVSQQFTHDHPERVAALAVFDATALFGTPMSLWTRWGLALSHLVLWAYPYGALIEATAKGSAITPAVQDYIRRTAGRLTKADYIGVWSAVQTGLRSDPAYRVPCPLLIALGDQDRIGIVATAARDWARRVPEAEFAVIPDAGHCANQDNPEFATELLVDFLGRHWAGALDS